MNSHTKHSPDFYVVDADSAVLSDAVITLLAAWAIDAAECEDRDQEEEGATKT